MSIVNFSIPKTLEQRVNKQIKEKGFAGKAEFFRMAAMYFLDHGNSAVVSEKEKTDFLIKAIAEEVQTKFKNKKIKSVREQLADL